MSVQTWQNVCMCVVCDVIRRNGGREEPSWWRQCVSLDVCTHKTPGLCLMDRTVPKIAMDSVYRASAKEKAGSTNPTEVPNLAIIRKPRVADRRVVGDF